jgi:hypothetical protein
MIEIPKPMKEMVDVKEEDGKIKEKLLEIAVSNKCCILGFIASYRPAKVTPTKFERAEVGLSEEFGIEQAILDVKEKFSNIDKCFVLLNSPGGLVDSSYKIAYLLRKSFNDITIFIPHMALSGGTLIALSGNTIVMGPMSQLSPLDVQLTSEDYQFSTKSVLNAFWRSENYFSKIDIEDAPYPWKSFADQLNPILFEECSALLQTMKEYTKKILMMGMFSKNEEKAEEISEKLVYEFLTHNYVINFEEAKKLGLKVKYYKDFLREWNVFREWLALYAPKSTDKHFIRYIIPEKEDKNAI